jgi:hypothetical protein
MIVEGTGGADSGVYTNYESVRTYNLVLKNVEQEQSFWEESRNTNRSSGDLKKNKGVEKDYRGPDRIRGGRIPDAGRDGESGGGPGSGSGRGRGGASPATSKSDSDGDTKRPGLPRRVMPTLQTARRLTNRIKNTRHDSWRIDVTAEKGSCITEWIALRARCNNRYLSS